MGQLLFLLVAIAFPFIAMPLMWRRMKHVRAQAYKQADTLPAQAAWQESLKSESGLDLVRVSQPNDDLIALGAKANQAPWTLTNQ